MSGPYKVTWQIDAEDSSSLFDAAQYAQRMQQMSRDGYECGVFTVTNKQGNTFRVDLDNDNGHQHELEGECPFPEGTEVMLRTIAGNQMYIMSNEANLLSQDDESFKVTTGTPNQGTFLQEVEVVDAAGPSVTTHDGANVVSLELPYDNVMISRAVAQKLALSGHYYYVSGGDRPRIKMLDRVVPEKIPAIMRHVRASIDTEHDDYTAIGKAALWAFNNGYSQP